MNLQKSEKAYVRSVFGSKIEIMDKVEELVERYEFKNASIIDAVIAIQKDINVMDMESREWMMMCVVKNILNTRAREEEFTLPAAEPAIVKLHV